MYGIGLKSHGKFVPKPGNVEKGARTCCDFVTDANRSLEIAVIGIESCYLISGNNGSLGISANSGESCDFVTNVNESLEIAVNGNESCNFLIFWRQRKSRNCRKRAATRPLGR